ncbi:Zinc finger protein [Pseudolycoriella hygida]|uniref:Zinc finger protein n=1 Tax=Pseudolycoriella hygida TaxID=35572 RepID=A0A9Q0MUG4_9DIPT|nr:Zinc finger protein [Pseudolycoriella hygida]
MSLLIGWDSICRICLKEGDLSPIFDGDEDVSEKIMLCSSIEVKKGMNFPEQICSNCLSDLDTAHKFRKTCESSDAILSSFVITNTERPTNEVVFSTESGDIYKFRAPSSLKVQRIKREPVTLELTDSEPDPEPDAEMEPVAEANVAPEFEFVEQSTVDYLEGDENLVDEDDNTVYYVEQIREDELEYYEAIEKEASEVEDRSSNDFNKTSSTDATATMAATSKKQFKNVNRPPNKFVPKPESNVMSAEVITKENGKKVYRVKRMFKDETKPLKECAVCGNQYKYQHALDSHMRRHNNEKPFECDICGKAFVINFELNRHKRIHSGEKPYKCQYCDRRFSDFGSRIKHERTHTGERPYKCEICGKAFAYSHVLNSHNLIHTGEKKYHCETCGKRFTKSHHLKAHLNTHEKNKSSKSSTKQLPEARYYTDIMKVITPSSRPADDEEIHIIQEGDIIQSDGLAILESDDMDIKEGISMIFEDGTIVQSQ